MSFGGTDLYDTDDPGFPAQVCAGVLAARDIGFGLCVHPATGRLLQSLAGGVRSGGLIGEAGTGTGVGVAWMASAIQPGVRIVSIEIDEQRAIAAQKLFADTDGVTVLHDDAAVLAEHGPFDLLVLDGGPGAGKSGTDPIDPQQMLVPGGTMTVDDFTPMSEWPPLFQGQIDTPRHHWLSHPDLLTTEVCVAPDMAVLVGRRYPPAAAPL